MLQQHSCVVGTRREFSVEYAVFGGSSYSNYFVRFDYQVVLRNIRYKIEKLTSGLFAYGKYVDRECLYRESCSLLFFKIDHIAKSIAFRSSEFDGQMSLP
uniref:Uncharacterized protein n=1 Tax=Heterorhabditis bacteriophora TaxID=37862 RepID=A0A1I7X3U3_HETBA